jgi:hypothetical protein
LPLSGGKGDPCRRRERLTAASGPRWRVVTAIAAPGMKTSAVLFFR